MQKETKHTAADWNTANPKLLGNPKSVYWGNNLVAVCGKVSDYDPYNWSTTTPAEQEANARLIAAAPELLEALEGILELAEIGMRQIQYEVSEKVQGTMYNKNDVLNAEEAYSTAEKAIAKARGGHE